MGKIVNLEDERRARCLIDYCRKLLGIEPEPWQVEVLRTAARTRQPVMLNYGGAVTEQMQGRLRAEEYLKACELSMNDMISGESVDGGTST